MPVPTTDAAGKLMAKSAARGKQSQDDAAIYKAANSPSFRISVLKKALHEARVKFRDSTGETQQKLAEEITSLRSQIAKLNGGGGPMTPLNDDGSREELDMDLSHGDRGFSSWVDRQLRKS